MDAFKEFPSLVPAATQFILAVLRYATIKVANARVKTDVTNHLEAIAKGDMVTQTVLLVQEMERMLISQFDLSKPLATQVARSVTSLLQKAICEVVS